MVYQASPIKRRATRAEMSERAAFLIDYAARHAPVTVRQLFYAATVAGVPGIEKTEAGYNKVQAQVLGLRRAGQMPYGNIADGTRWMIRPNTHDGWEDALEATAQTYRKALWSDRLERVEIWLEKDALAGVIQPITSQYDVPLAPTRGYTSETFAHNAVDALRGVGKALTVYALYDFDRSGRDAANSLREKVERFGAEFDVVVNFHQLGLTHDQVQELDLPTRPAKRNTAADKRWPYPFAAELDAIPPDVLRGMVQDAIEQHLPRDELEHLKKVEQHERTTLYDFIGRAA
ncbi:MAG: hypothetical protein AAGK37_08620 [Pseudomonadota bacterium]